jgi:hypothetical protein
MEDVETFYDHIVYFTTTYLVYFAAIWYILWLFAIFFLFWYVVLRKIWQPYVGAVY